MKKYMDTLIPVAVIGLLIIVFVFLVGSKAYAKSVETAVREQREVLESAYISSVKETLQEEGFANSGVNMTKITNEEGEWEYTVIIYHRSVEWMEENDKIELEQTLAEMGSDSLGKISLELCVR